MIHTGLKNELICQIKDRGTKLEDEAMTAVESAVASLESEIDDKLNRLSDYLRGELRDIDSSRKLDLGGDRVDKVVKAALENAYKTYSH